ncbi:unnamed protein product [Ambrosiozyma monospora]|uniref:Unnamed protein product n=1 Tax=Ambrosiozyma monospora TaxID=43982 RepID=A0A9W6WHB7_AMBMO|nr:unnamed protein product [Ambrosiozyma monospora]
MKPFRLASLASPGSGSSINNKKKSPTPSPRTPSFKINIMKGKSAGSNSNDDDNRSSGSSIVSSMSSVHSTPRRDGTMIVNTALVDNPSPLSRNITMAINEAERKSSSSSTIRDPSLGDHPTPVIHRTDTDPYGAYDVPKTEDIKMSYDDDFDLDFYDESNTTSNSVKKTIQDSNNNSKNNKSKGSFIDYGDDDEFPTDEKNMTISIS